MGEEAVLRYSVLAVIPYAIFVSETAVKLSVWNTVYAVLCNAYVLCTVYAICVTSAGQSVFWGVHVRQLMFQCFYAHVGAVVVLYVLLLDAKGSAVLTYLLMGQSHAYMLLGVRSVRFRGISTANLCICLSTASALVLLWSQYATGVDLLSSFNLTTARAVASAKHSLLLLLVPEALFVVSGFVSRLSVAVASE
eukprot:1977203-Rhodomonas_salina.2